MDRAGSVYETCLWLVQSDPRETVQDEREVEAGQEECGASGQKN